jgi:hypothetical protein
MHMGYLKRIAPEGRQMTVSPSFICRPSGANLQGNRHRTAHAVGYHLPPLPGLICLHHMEHAGVYDLPPLPGLRLARA